MVAMHLAPEVGITEHLAIDALTSGWAAERHFNVLADCRDLLALAARRKGDESALVAAEMGLIVLSNIKTRYMELQRLGATGDEMQALQAMVSYSEDFWKRTSGEFFREMNELLTAERAAQ